MFEKQRRTASPVNPAAVAEAEARLADRLDRLSAPLAEQVMHRAIELHQEQEIEEPGSVSFAELSSVAAELGIDEATLRQALVEQLDTGDDGRRSLWSRLFGPPEVRGGIVAEGDEQVVADQIAEWMREVESMYPVREDGSTLTWQVVGSPGKLASALANLGQEAVITRQTPLASGDQLVEIEIPMSKGRTAALLSFAGCALIAGVAGAGIGLSVDSVPELVGALGGFGIGSGAMLGAFVAIGQAVMASSRRHVNRALDGIVHLTTFGRRGRAARRTHGDKPTWNEIVDEIDDA